MHDSDSTGGSSGTPRDVAGRLRDLDEALRRERQERNRLERACEEAKKLVHALNNALSIITAFTAAMRDEVGPRDSLRESVEEIARAAKRAAAVARQLGDLRR